MQQFDYLVIGGGSGGIASARRAAAYGAKVGLIEAGRIGGTCVNLGCVPKKIMWTTSCIAEILHDAPSYGFNIKQNGFDWKVIKQARDKYVERLGGIYHRGLDVSGVTKIEGWARFTGEREVMIGEQTYRGEHVLIATGGRPKIPEDIPGAELGITSDGFFQLTEQPKRVVVVGGGYIAVELAGLLNGLGSQVVMLLRKDQLLREFDNSMRETLMDEMTKAGVNIFPYIKLHSVERDENGRLALVHGDSGGVLKNFDCLLWATGRQPNTRDLNLSAAGVTTDAAGFVVTDEFQNTNIKNVYAVGDVTPRRALTPVAIAAGRRLADRVFGKKSDSKLDYDNIPSVVFSHPPLGTVGLTEEQAHEEYGSDMVKVYHNRFTNLYYGVLERRSPTVVKLVTVGSQERIVGCHIIGDAADEIIQGFAVAVKMGATQKALYNTVAIHPTAAEELVTLR